MKIGDTIRFAEEDAGVFPEPEGEAVRADEDGRCSLWFGGTTIIDYSPGVIQEGLEDDTLVIVSGNRKGE